MTEVRLRLFGRHLCAAAHAAASGVARWPLSLARTAGTGFTTSHHDIAVDSNGNLYTGEAAT